MRRGDICRLLAAAVAVALLAPVSGIAAPAGGIASTSLSAREEELKRVREQLDTQRDRLEQTLRHERRLSDEVQRLDRQREATEARLARLSSELRRVRLREEAAASALARAEVSLAHQRARLADRLVDANRLGRAGYLDVVLGATTFPEFVARARLVSAIIYRDARLIETYGTDRDRTAELREELEDQHAQVRALMEETADRQQVLAGQGAQKRVILEQIMRERAVTERAVRELEEDSAQLAALIQRLQGVAVRPRGVTGFVLPLRGSFTSRFGSRIHPLFRRRHLHTGVDISAPLGTPVRAAQDGIVLFTGWYGGYGKLIVLDHGEAQSTLYGHLSAISVRTGDRVARNQIIGRVGSTGYSTGPHLHFEVRYNGRPIDPLR